MTSPPSGLPEGEEECFGSAPGHEDGKFSTIIFLPALKWRIYDQKIFLSLMAVLGLFLSAHAQEREITGSVKDHAGAGIVGATILVEGTTKGTTSGADGSFSIKAAPDNVLVVSFMGYQSHTIKVGTQTRIDVVLKENTQAIDDVIVVAFGTAKRRLSPVRRPSSNRTTSPSRSSRT